MRERERERACTRMCAAGDRCRPRVRCDATRVCGLECYIYIYIYICNAACVCGAAIRDNSVNGRAAAAQAWLMMMAVVMAIMMAIIVLVVAAAVMVIIRLLLHKEVC